MRCRLSLVAMVSFAIALTAVSPVFAETGVTDTTIKLGGSVGTSGAIAYWGEGIKQGVTSYINWLNEQGGVNGRKIEWVLYDDGYEPARTVSNTRRLLDRDQVFALVGHLGTPTTMAVLPTVIKERVPLFPTSFSRAWSYPVKRYLFLVPTSYYHQNRLLAEYIVGTLKKEHVAVVYQNDDFGLEQYNGIRDGLNKHGLSPAVVDTFARGAVDVGPQIANLRKANPDIVVLGAEAVMGARLAQEMQKVGWKVQLMGTDLLATDKYLELAGVAGEGTIVTRVYPPATATTAAVTKYRELLKKYFPEAKPDLTSLHGYTVMLVVAEGLKRAGRDITREKFIDAMEAIRDFDTGVIGKMTFGKADHQGGTSGYFSQVKDRKFVDLSGLIEVSD
jgi:branched-chain amino acid transport system substrate-binding protein